MFEENINLVYWIVFRKFHSYGNKEDLIQEGFIGLMKAERTFKEDKGNAFITYAWKCIVNQIKGYLRKEQKNKLLNFSDLEEVNLDTGKEETNHAKIAIDIVMKSLKLNKKIILSKLLQGKTQQEIADEFGVSKGLINKKFKEIKGVFYEANSIREIH